jgi:hypothetical protein
MRDICLSIFRMSCMLFRARGRVGSRVRIVRIAARCPRAKSRVFVRRHILFARRLRVIVLFARIVALTRVCRAPSCELFRVPSMHCFIQCHVSTTCVTRRLRVIINCFRLRTLMLITLICRVTYFK